MAGVPSDLETAAGRVDFREPVSQLGVRVPAVYLTVEDIEGFAAARAERGLSGTDARRPARLPPRRRGWNWIDRLQAALQVPAASAGQDQSVSLAMLS